MNERKEVILRELREFLSTSNKDDEETFKSLLLKYPVSFATGSSLKVVIKNPDPDGEKVIALPGVGIFGDAPGLMNLAKALLQVATEGIDRPDSEIFLGTPDVTDSSTVITIVLDDDADSHWNSGSK